jgi:Two component regulator propeller
VNARQLVSAIVMTILPSTVLALDPAVLLSQYGHTNWRSRDGTLAGMPFAMAQTSDGLLWIGTDNGLLTFDGVRFTRWLPPFGDSLPSNVITSLLAARDGTTWIGTYAGLAHLHSGTLTRYPEVSDAIGDFVEDRHGVVWFCRRTAAVTDPGCGVAEQMRCYGPSSGIPQSLVSSLHIGVHDDIGVGTDTALVRWDRHSATNYPLARLKTNFSQLGVTGIETTGGNDLWIGAAARVLGGGLRRFSNGRSEPFRVQDWTGVRSSSRLFFATDTMPYGWEQATAASIGSGYDLSAPRRHFPAHFQSDARFASDACY